MIPYPPMIKNWIFGVVKREHVHPLLGSKSTEALSEEQKKY